MKTEVNHLQDIKRLLKHRMKCGSVNIFQEFDSEIQKIRNLLLRSSEIGESNSLLVIGPRGCGKTSVSIFKDFVFSFMLTKSSTVH